MAAMSMTAQERVATTVAKVIELTAESPESFEDAIRRGIEKAGESLHGIKSAWVSQQQVKVENGEVVAFRVDLKVTFVLD
jgi:flavin-binding protein dodecin